jgi:hypothetical protein
MAATLVTGYVRLDSVHRPHDRYAKLGRRLLGLGLPGIAYYDGPEKDLVSCITTRVRPASLKRCWLHGPAVGAQPPHGDPVKDTVAYCVVQHQKSKWLSDAAALVDSDLLVWIDFGIFHLPQVTDDLVMDYLDVINETAPRDRITAPQAWPLTGRPLIDWSKPAWYLLGGVMVMPTVLSGWFHDKCVQYATLQLESTGRATWEVNTWAAIARDNRNRFAFYQANHDETIFSGYTP